MATEKIYKPLEALETIKREAGTPYFSTLYDIDMWREDFKSVETALKALEIIVKKGVAVSMLQLKEVGVKEYNDFIGDQKLYLTQEEIDFLKEILE